MGEKGGRVFRNIYKGHMDKTKEGRIRSGRWEGIMREKGERPSRNIYKGHMDKTKER